MIEDKATDHALFCKYAGELLEIVAGKTSTVFPSLSKITKVLSIFPFPLQQ